MAGGRGLYFFSEKFLSVLHVSSIPPPPPPSPLEWPHGTLCGMVLDTATQKATSVHPSSGMECSTPACSFSRQKAASQPGAGDAEHCQLPMAHRRPAGAGGHCQCVQGPKQGRTRPWPGPRICEVLGPVSTLLGSRAEASGLCPACSGAGGFGKRCGELKRAP